MTAGAPSPALLLPSQVAELLQTMVKALRAFQIYLPNNPIYHRAVENVRQAFAPIWSAVDELVLSVGETELRWENEVVYSQLSKADSLAWVLCKDGMRVLSIKRGAEEEEVVRLLEVINRARFLPHEASDDLMTLLWEQDFQFIQYHFMDFEGEGEALEGALMSAGETGPGGRGDAEPAAAEARAARVREEAPSEAAGLVQLEDFDSTLYFLEPAEIDHVAAELQEEYGRDVRAAALNALFDIFELQSDPAVRDEVLGVLETLLPNLLNRREFRAVASLLREARLLASRTAGLTERQRERLQSYEAQLSEPGIVAQLVQSLDESGPLAGDADLIEVLRELRPTALGALVTAVPKVTNAQLRALLEATVDRLAAAHQGEVLRLLREGDPEALPGAIALAGRLQVPAAVGALGELLGHPTPAVRLAVVQALERIGSPNALTHLDRALEDADRAVRLAAIRVLGSRGYKGALRRVEAVVLGKAHKDLDLTERMAFFEAYGAIAGAAGVKTLSTILLSRGLIRFKEPPESRACAAIALGKLRTPEARAALAQAAEDKDLVVRNAVNRALREPAA